MDELTRRDIEWSAQYGNGRDVYDACKHLYQQTDLEEAAKIIERRASPFVVKLKDSVLIDGTEIGRWGTHRTKR